MAKADRLIKPRPLKRTGWAGVFLKLTAWLFVWIAVLLAVFGSEVNTQAQDLADFTLEPSMADLGCNSGTYCILDAGRESRLFVYLRDTAQLWLYPSDGGEAINIDLSPFQADFGTTYILDFIAISDTELLFIGATFDTGRNELTIYDLDTGQIREPAVELGGIYLTPCDGMPSYPIDNLYRFPNSSRILLCGILDGIRRFVIVDFETEQIVQVIDFPGSRPNPYLLPWLKLLVGQDGAIYVHGFGRNTAEALFPAEPRSTWANGLIAVAKFDLDSQEWSLVMFSEDLIQTNHSTGEFIGYGSIYELAAVDAAGNLIYWNSAWQYRTVGDSKTSKHVPLLTVFDHSGQLITQIPPDWFPNGEKPVFRYESISGEMVFTVQSPPGLFAIHPSEILSVPTPDSMPTLP